MVYWLKYLVLANWQNLIWKRRRLILLVVGILIHTIFFILTFIGQFFLDLFAVRVLDDESRLSQFEQFVQKKCEECMKVSEFNNRFNAGINNANK